MRSAVTSTINAIGSTIVITPYTQSTSDDGYSGQVPIDGTAVTETAIPFEEFKSLIKQKFGNLETGGFQLAVKYTAVFDLTGATKYRCTYNSEDYDIVKANRYSIENVLVAWILDVSRRFD